MRQTKPASQTGKWTVDAATDNVVALTLIAETVFSQCLSAQKVAHSPQQRNFKVCDRG